jgi:hypothetical protein
MGNKFFAIKTRSSDGILHDSGKEAYRWEELLLLQRAGKIKDLKRQVKFVLIPTQRETVGKKTKVVERECSYVADFVYTRTDNGKTVVEDTKSPITRTKEYVIKRKLMRYIHGIAVHEV